MVKLGREAFTWYTAHQSLPSGAEVRKEWSYNAVPSCTFMASTRTAVPSPECHNRNRTLSLHTHVDSRTAVCVYCGL